MKMTCYVKNLEICFRIKVMGIKLYSTREELRELIEMKETTSKIIFDEWIRYDIQESVELLFHLKNDKLFRITTLDNYQGKLFEQIGVGSTEKELLEVEASFIYDDFEEVWVSEKGIFVETDAETNLVRWISVYVRELNDEDFQEANW